MPGHEPKTMSGGWPAVASAKAGKIRAVLVDDQLLFRLGLRLFLTRAMPEVVILGEADSATEGLRLADRIRPDLLLLDASLPDGSTDRTVAVLTAVVPHCRIFLLANLPDTASLVPALSAGAHGCLLKTAPPEQLISAIRQVMAGQKWIQPDLAVRFVRDHAPVEGRARRARAALAEDEQSGELDRPLTGREMEVLRLIVAGHSNAQIARELKISEQTVKTHLAHVMRKIDVRSRLQAARYAITRGLVEV